MYNMKKISQLRDEIASHTASSESTDAFGTQLVGRLLSLNEVALVAGGDATCYSGSTSHSQSGGGNYGQVGGQYTQSGGGGYTMTCRMIP
jgi:hypothetical protein